MRKVEQSIGGGSTSLQNSPVTSRKSRRPQNEDVQALRQEWSLPPSGANSRNITQPGNSLRPSPQSGISARPILHSEPDSRSTHYTGAISRDPRVIISSHCYKSNSSNQSQKGTSGILVSCQKQLFKTPPSHSSSPSTSSNYKEGSSISGGGYHKASVSFCDPPTWSDTPPPPAPSSSRKISRRTNKKDSSPKKHSALKYLVRK